MLEYKPMKLLIQLKWFYPHPQKRLLSPCEPRWRAMFFQLLPTRCIKATGQWLHRVQSAVPPAACGTPSQWIFQGISHPAIAIMLRRCLTPTGRQRMPLRRLCPIRANGSIVILMIRVSITQRIAARRGRGLGDTAIFRVFYLPFRLVFPPRPTYVTMSAR